jgi:proline iminopeptidase
MAEVTANGVRLFWTEQGSGVPFIVVHGGLGFDHTYMKHSLDPLGDVMSLVYFDQRGNGRSERVPLEQITIPQLADDIDAFADAIGLERFGVIGHSYGGFIALEYATRYADRLTHLICHDTSPGRFEPTPDELAERADPSWITPEIQAGFAAFAQGLPSDNDEMRARFPELAPVYLKSSPVSVLTELVDAMILDAKTAGASMAYLPQWSVADKLGSITCPTLVLCGRYDLMTTPECSKRLSTAIPDAELVWFEDSGHFPELEEPEAFHAAIRDWLARHPIRT